ncbi:MAG: anthranilate phosphoribosyltransferase [Calditrichia bacterium]
MKTVLEKLYQHQTLSRREAADVVLSIGQGAQEDIHIAAFLSALNMRPVTIEELKGFRDALLELSFPVDFSDFDPIDVCGTGGDSKFTFNISTTAAFVVAGAGIPVAKHGNYAVSSYSGSSNVLEYFGISFSNNKDLLQETLDKANFAYLHAPLFHPAMKHVASVRRSLGVKTFFNMLGPLINPARVKKQIIGVYRLDLIRIFGYVLSEDLDNYKIIASIDGYDEISLTSPFKYMDPLGEKMVDPSEIGFSPVSPEELKGGSTISEAAEIFLNILSGKGTGAQHDVVVTNAAYAIHTALPQTSIDECIALAKESLNSGAALEKFNIYKKIMIENKEKI